MSKIQINGDLTQNSKNGNNPVTLNITGGSVSGGGSDSSGFIFDTSAIQLKADKISVRKSSSNTPVAIENIAIPTTDYQAANKKYVDDSIAGVGQTENYLPLDGGTMNANAAINFDDSDSSSTLTSKVNSGGLNSKVVLGSMNYEVDLNPYQLLFKEGGSDAIDIDSRNGINMSQKPIMNLPTPTSDAQPATKKYVDDAISSGGSSSGTHLGRLKFSAGSGNIYLDIIEMGEGYLLSLNTLMATISSKTNANETLTLDDPPNLKGFNGMLPICAGNTSSIIASILTITYNDGTWSLTPASNGTLSGASGGGCKFVYKSSVTTPN